jgi:hypothetical protein
MRVMGYATVVAMAACTSAPGGKLGGGNGWNDSNETTGNTSSGGGGTKGGMDAGVTQPPSIDASQPPPMPDAGPCKQPADCPMGQVCCGTLVLDPNQVPCGLASHSRKCEPANGCPTMLTLQCTTQQVRGCQASTDCTEPNFPKCCSLLFGLKSATFCVDDVLAQVAVACN